MQRMLDSGGDSAFSIRASPRPPARSQLFGCIPHDKWVPGESQHFNIVIVITNGHDLIAVNLPVLGPTFQRVPLGAAGIEHINDREVAAGVFGAVLASIPGL